jgi:hypothetical protein
MSRSPSASDREEVSLQTTLPVAGAYDVVVVGGGPAGTVAAIQAARAGADTALVEKNGMLGGTTTVGGVNFPGLFHAWGEQIIDGIGWELIEETVRRDGATLPDFSSEPDRHWEHQIRVDRLVYAAVLDDTCLSSGVDLRLHEMPARVERAADGYTVYLTGKRGLSAVRAATLVDATGDANVAEMVDLPRERGEELQPGTLIYRLGGYDIDDVDEATVEARHREALEDGRLKETDGSPWRVLSSGGGNVWHVPDVDGSSSPGRTEAELQGRERAMEMYRFLRTIPGCEDLTVDFVAPECGIRESYRIQGEKSVDYESYVSGRLWDDAVCYSFYPIDIHQSEDTDIDIRPLSPGTFPTIPYGALLPRGSERLLAAGRCVAGDREANSAYRVQASCMATGQAAGAAAALASKDGGSVQDVDVDRLRDLLAAHGAVVPSDPPPWETDDAGA